MKAGILKWFSLALVLAAGCGMQASTEATGTPDATASVVTGGDIPNFGLPDPTPTPGANLWYGEADISKALTLNNPVGPNNLPVIDILNGALGLTAKTLATNLPLMQDANENGDSMGRPDLRGSGAGLKVYRKGRTWGGYTLLTSLGYIFKENGTCTLANGGYKDWTLPPPAGNPDCQHTRYGAVLIDMDGNVVNSWPLSGFPAKILPGGYVMGGDFSPVTSPTFGLTMTSVKELDWCGNPVQGAEWFPIAEAGFKDAGFHHDFQRSGNPVGYYAPGQCPDPNPANGTTLFLQNHVTLDKAFGGPNAILDDGFYEIDAVGNAWSWHAMDKIDQMGFDKPARDAISNAIVPTGGPGYSDWTHGNDLNRLGPNRWYAMGDQRFHPDNLIFDFRSSGVLGIVARHDHPKGKWLAGDIVWRVGPNYGYGNPEYSLGQIIGPHNTHMIPAGLPGAGDILVFDNGGYSGFGSLVTGLPGMWPNKFRPYSRVLEFNPITLEVVWEYAFPAQDDTTKTPKFYSAFISNTQRLPNGNTLITQGGNGRLFEVTMAGDIVWEYIAPFHDVAPFIPGGAVRPNAVYRSYRIPKSWIPASLLKMQAGPNCTMPAGWTFPTTCGG